MNNRWSRRAALVIALLAALAAPVSAQNRVGEIVYLEDQVSLLRNSREVPDVDIGTVLENYDLISTGPRGFAELRIDSPRVPPTTLKISPNTRFYVELNTVGGKSTTTVGMLSGSLSVKVAKISGRQQVEVATESALMGVRGTTFDVTITPAGEVLVSSEEGQVSCIDDGGEELFAAPGEAVEKRPGELFRNVPVAVSTLQEFRKQWIAERVEAFKANALRAIGFYARRYLALKDRFDAAYALLDAQRDVIRKWYEEDRQDTTGGSMDVLREKKRLVSALLELRKVNYLFERTYFRLLELQDYYRQGYGRGLIEPNLSVDAFFARFERERQDLARKMAEVRYVTKLYARRNGGEFPTDLF
jgi:hypothetical protein